MKILKTPTEVQSVLSGTENNKIGFVPTMGAFHEGHLSLIRMSLRDNDITVVSIYVNPTQFNDKDDLAKYPNTIDEDIKKLKDLDVDYLFLPEYRDLYPDDFNYKIVETELSKELCGASRPGHFTGVLTVVMKLFNIVKPNRAYFGEKDYQQLMLIKGMADAFFMDIEIIAGMTIREEDGLAMSSRNLLLTSEERKKASVFPDLLRSKLSDEEVIRLLQENGFKVDYIEQKFGRRFGAVYLGQVRLIDNV